MIIDMQTLVMLMSMQRTCCITTNDYSAGLVADLVACNADGQPVTLQIVLAFSPYGQCVVMRQSTI